VFSAKSVRGDTVKHPGRHLISRQPTDSRNLLIPHPLRERRWPACTPILLVPTEVRLFYARLFYART
jgi:hypothetical protein